VDLSDLSLDPDELGRVAACAQEPIRTPGRVQAHGTLFGVAPESDRIVVVSDDAEEWLDKRIVDLGEPQLEYAVRSGVALDPVRLTWRGAPADAIVHRADGLCIVEIDPLPPGNDYARVAVVTAIQKLAMAESIAELREIAAREIRQITGFDRVMVYEFQEDDHGIVVADDRESELESYLGLHFPASDIPSQARALYLSKIGRTIASVSTPPRPLVSREIDPATLDLSDAELRAVSPRHLEFMRNMGQAATFSLSLVENGRLTGMITCAHRTDRRLPILLRRSLEVLAGQLSLQMTAMREIESLRRTVQVRERRAALLAPLYASDDVTAALFQGKETVLDLVPADGVVARIGPSWRVAGTVPPLAPLAHVVEALGDTPIVSDALAAEYPELAAVMPGVAGLLAVPLAQNEGALLFFRSEVPRNINWLGDPGRANHTSELSPRASFAMWQQQVRGRSAPWGPTVDEAVDLAHELDVALSRRAESRLAELAMRDALTGLHNRRYLVERLATRGPVGPDGKALLFVDLDDFKRVNDEHGHDAGDAVILEVAKRLRANSRDNDDVVRLGGDEFVVLMDGVTGTDVHAIAERLVQSVAVPIEVGSTIVRITASCGVVVAEPGTPRTGLLEAADAAMYRAKRAGRNRIAS
jgi:diguanylate cyclase (GGDEF)-like protein